MTKQTENNDARLLKLIDAAVNKGLDQLKAKAPTVITDEPKTKSYIDDQIKEAIGAERADIRRDSEKRGARINRTTGEPVFADRVKSSDAGLNFAAYVGFLSACGGKFDDAVKLAKKRGADPLIVKALSESTFSSGGAFVPEAVAADYIELLYNASVFLEMGPRRINVAHGNLTLPKLTGGASAYWLGESTNVTPSQQSTGQERLDLKKLGVMTVSSNEFLRDSSPSAIDMIRMDIAETAGVAVDAALLRGTGSAYSPRGLASLVHADHQEQTAGTTVAFITTDLIKAMQNLEDANIRNANLAWFMSPRSKWGIMSKRDANNNEVWAPEMRGGTLYGAPFRSTTNIPNNVGAGGTSSEVYLAAMNHLVLGEDSLGVQIQISDTAAYHDGANVQAAFSRDESVVRLIQRLDLVERQGGKAISQIYDVAYAA